MHVYYKKHNFFSSRNNYLDGDTLCENTPTYQRAEEFNMDNLNVVAQRIEQPDENNIQQNSQNNPLNLWKNLYQYNKVILYVRS